MNDNQLQIYTMQAEICKTLADPKRLMIVHELRGGELPVGEIGTRLGIPQANISQHLAILRKHGVVLTRREGTSVFYRLASGKIAEACNLVRGVLSDQLESNSDLSDLLKTTSNK